MKKILRVCVCATLLLWCVFAGSAADAGQAPQSAIIRDVLARGVLRVGLDPGYMPFAMTDAGGTYVGFDIDLGKELAAAMKVTFEPVTVRFDEMIPALLEGRVDVVISAMTITQERNLRIAFSDPYIVVGQSILLNAEHEHAVTSWQQLNDPKYTIASRHGTTGEEAVRRYMPKAVLASFDRESEGALEVVEGRADAWVYDMPFNVVFFARQGQGKVVHLDKPFTYEPLGIGVRQGDPDFMNFLNNFLRQIKADGRYDRMYNKWIRSTTWFEDVAD